MIDSPRRRGVAPLDAVGTNNGSWIETRIASSHLPRLIPLHCFGVAWRFVIPIFPPCRHDKEATPLPRNKIDRETCSWAPRGRVQKHSRPPGLSRERREIKLNLQLRGILRSNSLLTPRVRTELPLTCWVRKSLVNISNVFKYIKSFILILLRMLYNVDFIDHYRASELLWFWLLSFVNVHWWGNLEFVRNLNAQIDQRVRRWKKIWGI